MPFNPVIQSIGQVQAPTQSDWTSGLDVKTDWTSGLDVKSEAPKPSQPDPQSNTRAVVESAIRSIPGLGGLLQKTGLDTKLAQTILDHPAAAGAIAAGLATAPLTGGMSAAPAIGFAGLMGAGGASAGLLAHDVANADTPGNIPTPMESAKQIGEQGLASASGEGVGRGVNALASAASQRLMQSAVKPSKALLDQYRTTAPDLVKTFLDNGINVTESGLSKLQSLLDATNGQIRDAIRSSSAEIDPKLVAARVLPVAARQAQQVNPTAPLEAVGNSVSDFLQLGGSASRGMIPVQEAQAMKTGTYQALKNSYGEMSSASKEAQKALARGLKEEIAIQVPEVSALNAQDSALMAATDAASRRVPVAGNRDPVGFAWVTHKPLTFLSALVDRSPMVKSLLARGMYQMASQVSGVAPEVLQAAMNALVSGGGQ